LRGRLLLGPPGDHGRPVHGLDVDTGPDLLQVLRGHEGGGVREGRVRGVEDDDGLAVVAALFEELLGLLEVLLGRARRRLEGAPADEDAGAGLAVLWIADNGLAMSLLARHVREA